MYTTYSSRSLHILKAYIYPKWKFWHQAAFEVHRINTPSQIKPDALSLDHDL